VVKHTFREKQLAREETVKGRTAVLAEQGRKMQETRLVVAMRMVTKRQERWKGTWYSPSLPSFVHQNIALLS
jgi:hypothetical protein